MKEIEERVIRLAPWGLDNWIKLTGITEEFVKKDIERFHIYVQNSLGLDFHCPGFSLEEYVFEKQDITIKDFRDSIVTLPLSKLVQTDDKSRIVLYLNNIAYYSAEITALFEHERASKWEYQWYAMSAILHELVCCALLENHLKADENVVGEKVSAILKELPVSIRTIKKYD